MKRRIILYLAIISICLTSCARQETENANVNVTENANINVSEDSAIGTSVVLFKSIALPLPPGWVSKGGTMYAEEEPVLLVQQIQGFDEEELKDAFGYESTEECVRRYASLGAVGDTVIKKEVGDFTVYEMYVDEVEKYSEEQQCFIQSEDIVYVDFIIREEEKELYCFYFMNSMADSKNIEEYISKMVWYETDSDTDGRYRWLMQLY